MINVTSPAFRRAPAIVASSRKRTNRAAECSLVSPVFCARSRAIKSPARSGTAVATAWRRPMIGSVLQRDLGERLEHLLAIPFSQTQCDLKANARISVACELAHAILEVGDTRETRFSEANRMLSNVGLPVVEQQANEVVAERTCPSSSQAACTRPSGFGDEEISRRSGSIADRSCRSSSRRWAVTRHQAFGCSSSATSSCTLAELNRGWGGRS